MVSSSIPWAFLIIFLLLYFLFLVIDVNSKKIHLQNNRT